MFWGEELFWSSYWVWCSVACSGLTLWKYPDCQGSDCFLTGQQPDNVLWLFNMTSMLYFTIRAESNPWGTVDIPASWHSAVSLADLVKHSQWSGQMLDAEHRLTKDRKIVTETTFIFWLWIVTNIGVESFCHLWLLVSLLQYSLITSDLNRE